MQRDQIVIVDIEATCWENGAVPPSQQSEIIEIGVCLFDTTTFEPLQKRSILVKPQRSKVSEFCTQLTTLTQAQVDTGIPFEVACALLETEYLTSERAWASWGNYDHRMFQTQCESFVVRYPFSEHHTNLKKLFGRMCVKRKDKQVGMAQALAIAEMELEGTHHRGADDAWNIARILQYMVNRFGDGFLKKFYK